MQELTVSRDRGCKSLLGNVLGLNSSGLVAKTVSGSRIPFRQLIGGLRALSGYASRHENWFYCGRRHYRRLSCMIMDAPKMHPSPKHVNHQCRTQAGCVYCTSVNSMQAHQTQKSVWRTLFKPEKFEVVNNSKNRYCHWFSPDSCQFPCGRHFVNMQEP